MPVPSISRKLIRELVNRTCGLATKRKCPFRTGFCDEDYSLERHVACRLVLHLHTLQLNLYQSCCTFYFCTYVFETGAILHFMHPIERFKNFALVRLLHVTAERWVADDALTMGAALSYYALFSIAPLLLVSLTVTGMIFGSEAARGELEQHLEGYFGENAARSIQTLLGAIERSRGRSRIAMVIGVGVMLFGASSVFNQLKRSLNKIWKVEEPRHTGFKAIVVDRMIAVFMVAVVASLLLSSLLLSAVISRISTFATDLTPYSLSPQMLQFIDLGASFSLLTILFAIIFRFMPDVRIGWRSVALGAVVTSALFAIGKFLIGFYIAHGALASAYGAAGSVIVLLIWIYYSAQIFLFGAEFTHVYSRAHHLPAVPLEYEEK